jgi:hypothetical protein
MSLLYIMGNITSGPPTPDVNFDGYNGYGTPTPTETTPTPTPTPTTIPEFPPLNISITNGKLSVSLPSGYVFGTYTYSHYGLYFTSPNITVELVINIKTKTNERMRIQTLVLSINTTLELFLYDIFSTQTVINNYQKIELIEITYTEGGIPYYKGTPPIDYFRDVELIKDSCKTKLKTKISDLQFDKMSFLTRQSIMNNTNNKYSESTGLFFNTPNDLINKTTLQVSNIPDLSKTYYSLNSITKGDNDTKLYEDGLTMVIITDEHKIWILSKMQSHNR